jgi:hypothetical protein
MTKTTTIELDTTKEEVPSANGHEEWPEFDDDLAFINHIFNQEPAEKLVDLPEWKVKVLCRALPAEDRLRIQAEAYDKESKTTDYRRAFYLVLMAGCFNPKTGHKVFRESHKAKIMSDPRNGAPAEKLFVTILQLSSMLSTDAERARKN